MTVSLIISFIADDRPGLTERIASIVVAHDGNWEDARLVRLGGKFAGLMLVRLPDDREGALAQALGALSGEGIAASLTAAGESAETPTLQVTLDVLGPDRPGIVREITRALGARGLNILTLESRIQAAPMSAESLFSARITVAAQADTDTAELESALEQIAEATTLEIDLLAG